jgi:hypothetical protein
MPGRSGDFDMYSGSRVHRDELLQEPDCVPRPVWAESPVFGIFEFPSITTADARRRNVPRASRTRSHRGVGRLCDLRAVRTCTSRDFGGI